MSDKNVRSGKYLITLGHGPDKSGGYDNGAAENGTTESSLLRRSFYYNFQFYTEKK